MSPGHICSDRNNWSPSINTLHNLSAASKDKVKLGRPSDTYTMYERVKWHSFTSPLWQFQTPVTEILMTTCHIHYTEGCGRLPSRPTATVLLWENCILTKVTLHLHQTVTLGLFLINTIIVKYNFWNSHVVSEKEKKIPNPVLCHLPSMFPWIWRK